MLGGGTEVAGASPAASPRSHFRDHLFQTLLAILKKALGLVDTGRILEHAVHNHAALRGPHLVGVVGQGTGQLNLFLGLVDLGGQFLIQTCNRR